ncbi:hypothetical protein NL676_021588 [Syzygium grande]|nr:hypothetical protein NL676_021588 [Syzygium grande]
MPQKPPPPLLFWFPCWICCGAVIMVDYDVLTLSLSLSSRLLSPPITPSLSPEKQPPILGARDCLRASKVVLVPGDFRPKSLAFNQNGEGPYTGVADGWVLQWKVDDRGCVLPLLLPSPSLNCSFLLRSNARSLRSVLSLDQIRALRAGVPRPESRQARPEPRQARPRPCHVVWDAKVTSRVGVKLGLRLIETRVSNVEIDLDDKLSWPIRHRQMALPLFDSLLIIDSLKRRWLRLKAVDLLIAGLFNRWRARNSKLH